MRDRWIKFNLNRVGCYEFQGVIGSYGSSGSLVEVEPLSIYFRPENMKKALLSKKNFYLKNFFFQTLQSFVWPSTSCKIRIFLLSLSLSFTEFSVDFRN